MIVDCFPFASELNLLEARLKIIGNQVDIVLIQEVGETHAGFRKDILLSLDKWPLANYRDKIVLLQEDSFPHGLRPFEREWWQRNLATTWLNKNMSDGDVLIYGDVDEIPDPSKLDYAIQTVIQQGKPAFLAMDLHYCFLNYRESTGKLISNLGDFPKSGKHRARWLGTVVWPWSSARWLLPSQLRNGSVVNIESGFRLPDSGWHFSYIDIPGTNGYERFKAKLAMSAHQEFNNEKVMRTFWHRIRKGLDPLGRRGVRFEVMYSMSELPEVIRNLGLSNPDLLIAHEKFPLVD